jgi:polyisoprenoid-binding protein YceI
MKQIPLILSCFCFLVLSAFATYSAQGWTIGDDYVISFDGGGAKGVFRSLEGQIVFDENDLAASRMDVRVAIESIDTGNKTKDKHARGKNWLNAEKYPFISFQSKQFRSSKNGFEVEGELELHGTKKEIVIPFTFEQSGEGAVFEGAFSVLRKDYGIKGPFFGFTVGNDFKVNLRVPVEQPDR